jgi:hypothetical protein
MALNGEDAFSSLSRPDPQRAASLRPRVFFFFLVGERGSVGGDGDGGAHEDGDEDGSGTHGKRPQIFLLAAVWALSALFFWLLFAFPFSVIPCFSLFRSGTRSF